MRAQCRECGQPTNKGLPVCTYCRTGRVRPAHPCEDCGSLVNVRKDGSGQYRCGDCRAHRAIESMDRIARPILARGGTLAEIAQHLGVSGERVRQILSSHPELQSLRRATLEQRFTAALGEQLAAGEGIEEAARACGLRPALAHGIVNRNPGLKRLALRNQERRAAQRRIDRFEPVFRLVQAEGLSICAACRVLGIRCRMPIYRTARTREAQERYPVLRNVPQRRTIAVLQVAGEGLESAG